MKHPTAAVATRTALGVLVTFPPLYVAGLVLAYALPDGAVPGPDPTAPGWLLASTCCPLGAVLGLRAARRRQCPPDAPPVGVLVGVLVGAAGGAWLLLSALIGTLYYFPELITLAVGLITGCVLAFGSVTTLSRRGTPAAPTGPATDPGADPADERRPATQADRVRAGRWRAAPRQRGLARRRTGLARMLTPDDATRAPGATAPDRHDR